MLYFNKSAQFKYELDRDFEAGLALTGIQVKEIRSGKMNLKEMGIRFIRGELWLFNTGLVTDQVKLLLNEYEIKRISAYLDEKRHHVFPIGIFTKQRLLKLKIGLGVVKKQYQKTEQQKRKDVKIDLAKKFKERRFDEI